ncbi:PLC-like phosphodiesterase [Viridothelium virens]|uniref:PLC-like phosphodiesterase n=1 Tax=Viridothelium virens TaxID=1048519 RepID=A0A6A6H2V3_VIRVR|nr:PLC-like phosphodiesterase [Viridothelium virens]
MSQPIAICPFWPSAFPQTSFASQNKTCNNSPSLCSRAYNNVTHLGAHDSPFVRDQSTGFSTSGNQYYNSTVQLSAGVRLLSAQIHPFTSTSGQQEWHLCHTSCDLLDVGTLSDWLSEIKTWMDQNPNEVVTVLIVNDGASNSDLDSNFRAANITSYAYSPPTSATVPAEWPTLNTLITSGKRLMTFIAYQEPSSNTTTPYLMNEFTYIFENPFDVTQANNFTCTANRPSSVNGQTSKALQGNMMPLMNHFLDTQQIFNIETPNADAAPITNGMNGTGNLRDAVATCATDYNNKAPTFILVDFFNVGPAISTVDKLNGVASPVGRAAVSTSSALPSNSGPRGLVINTAGLGLSVLVAVFMAFGTFLL